jgi:hypothetical protein
VPPIAWNRRVARGPSSTAPRDRCHGPATRRALCVGKWESPDEALTRG